MTWQQYCVKLEGDLKTTEEDNNKLKQEIRGLEKRLIEARPTVELQRQLAQALQERDAARQEKDGIRNAAVERINHLRQQLANAEQMQRTAEPVETQKTNENTLRKLEVVERELEDERQEKQQLQRQLVERDKLLKEFRAAAAQKPPIPGGVSAKEYIAMLERQLKLCQKDNARLQDLSDRKNGKPCDDSDDSEPEYPRYECSMTLLGTVLTFAQVTARGREATSPI